MKREFFGGLAVAALAAVVFSGCAGAGGPMPSAGISDGATAVPSPASAPVVGVTPAASVAAVEVPADLPSLARTDTIQGGVAVAIAFIEEHPRLFQEGPSELFAFLSMAECEFCAHEQERALLEAADSGLQVGGDMRVDRSDPIFKLDTEEFGEPTLAVGLGVREEPYTFVNSAGEVTRSGEGQELEALLALQVRDGIWRVRAFYFRDVEQDEIPQVVLDAFEELDGA